MQESARRLVIDRLNEEKQKFNKLSKYSRQRAFGKNRPAPPNVDDLNDLTRYVNECMGLVYRSMDEHDIDVTQVMSDHPQLARAVNLATAAQLLVINHQTEKAA